MYAVKAIPVGLVGAAVVASALVASVMIRYPDMLDGGADVAFYFALLGVGLAVTVAAAALAGTRVGGRAWRGAMRDGCRWGLLLGGLWVVEMVIANLGYGLGGWTVVPYTVAIWAVWLLTAFAGAAAARRYRRIWAGTLVGAWSGLVSGLIGMSTMETLALAAMPVLRRDPQNIQEFRDAGDLSTAIAGDFLASGINHLVVVGLIASSVLATIGAAISLASRRPGLASST